MSALLPKHWLALLVLVTGLVAGCSTTSTQISGQRVGAERGLDEDRKSASLVGSSVPPMVIAEVFITTAESQKNLDSLASWMTPDGHRWVIATAKKSSELVVFDGERGTRLRVVGSKGSGVGQLDRPNGISVVDGLGEGQAMLLVVERDNHRVQMFQLPGFKPVMVFGMAELKKPYGLWAHTNGRGIEVFVSDNYMHGADGKKVPPLAQLDHRFRRYQLTPTNNGWNAALTQSFGDTHADGAIRIAESLYADVANDRLLLAEEDTVSGTLLREYSLANGQYLGRDVGAGLYEAQAEGIALQACKDGSGYWIGTDQHKERSVFHMFDRQTLQYVGSFSGNITANTDGVWMDCHGDVRFPQGVLYALHDDQAVSAFDWRDVAQALGLRQCSL